MGSLSDCQSNVSGYAGVYDNVYEWEDSCDGRVGLADYCRLRGGSFSSTDDTLRCVFGASSRADGNSNVGFRCCAP